MRNCFSLAINGSSIRGLHLSENQTMYEEAAEFFFLKFSTAGKADGHDVPPEWKRTPEAREIRCPRN